MGQIWDWKIHLPKEEEADIKEHLYGYMEKFFPDAKLEYFT